MTIPEQKPVPPNPYQNNQGQSPYGHQPQGNYPPGYQPGGQIPGADKKITAGILALLLGAFGVHKFMLGYTNEGVTMLVVTLVGIVLGACLIFPALAATVMSIIGLVEGIIYLTKSDEEFVQTYVHNYKGWF